MAQYGDEYGHVQNQELDSQAVHEIPGVNMADRGIVTHEGKNGLSSADNPLQQQPQQENYFRSEDEGEGDIRNKKGLAEKIVEKIPGIDRNQQESHDTNNVVESTAPLDATTRPGGEGNFGEKKNEIMEKIKEKIPGVGPKEQQSQDNNNAIDLTTTDDTTTIQGREGGFGEKKTEMIEKIKEIIPGAGAKEQQPNDTNNTVDTNTTFDAPTMPDGEGEVVENKKEVMEEIIEKIPRVPSERQSNDTTETTIPGDEGKHGDENKGLIEKIKEKLSGHNWEEPPSLIIGVLNSY